MRTSISNRRGRSAPILAVFVFLAATLVGGPANAAPGVSPALAPAFPGLKAHRAIYTLKLGELRSGASLVDARGAMISVMEKSCDGWMLAQTLTMEIDTVEGRTVKQNMRFAGWESLDGKTYRFVAKNKRGGEDTDFRGSAHAAAAAIGKAVFKIPKDKNFELPEGTMFPVGHMAWLIEKARSGARQAPRFLFDGADGTGPQQVDVFIGRRIQADDHGQARLGPLTEQAGWNMRMAFFPVKGQQSLPEYEIEVLQLENGVAPRMILDYEDFSVIMELEKIEAVPAPSC